MTVTEKFWENKRLDELTSEEWELLCDGCAQCCRLKFEDEETEKVAVTPVVCKLLDLSNRRCKRYGERHRYVPCCVKLNAHNIHEFTWLPDTCAYRLRAENKPLFDWHPLIADNSEKMQRSGVTVDDEVISEEHVHPEDIAQYAVKWV